MKNIKTFCITLVIYGLIITIGFVFGLIAPDKRSFSNWFGPALFLMLVMLLIGSYTISARCKILSLQISKNDKEVKNESPPPYRIERYVQRWWKYEDPDEDGFPTFVDLRGRRSQDPDERMRQAIEKWEQVKKQPNGVFLEEFLASEFGVTNGVLNVSKSKFYTRRRQLKKLAEEKQQNSNSKKG
jgi:hypothetical protein